MNGRNDVTMSHGNNDPKFPSEARRRFLTACACLTVLPLTEGCAMFGGAFHASDPVADRRAADKATRGALDELERCASLNSDKKLTVCFIGVTGGPNAGDLSNATRERLEGGSFRLLEKSDVQDALKESGVRANNIFIPNERRKFVEALGEDVDFLLAGYVERVDTDEDEERSRSKRTVYRLELVEIETNKKSTFTADL